LSDWIWRYILTACTIYLYTPRPTTTHHACYLTTSSLPSTSLSPCLFGSLLPPLFAYNGPLLTTGPVIAIASGTAPRSNDHSTRTPLLPGIMDTSRVHRIGVTSSLFLYPYPHIHFQLCFSTRYPPHHIYAITTLASNIQSIRNTPFKSLISFLRSQRHCAVTGKGVHSLSQPLISFSSRLHFLFQ
jgi:hypothetical protein